ncbi:endocuticle structural glycoprotein SgAbd-4-like [Agrilus planipennis]|uniref:Endocuticle structural glycoprotein SgAbd-4-like n=1 Tax=Agrilus planipennis TaxID=224129 RepID=A0A1W4XJX6_AGRPL|nr:endocuticle structural glycoprotein SgAbd-4-like [Agrilus planipennis]
MIAFVFPCLFAFAFGARLDNAFYNPNVLAYSGSPTPRPLEPQTFHNIIPILRYSSDNNEDGNYRFAYETGNGIAVQENGHLSGSVPEGPAVVSDGSFSYTGPDGHTYSISYTADENGFRPVGAHIPTPPPIPEAIAKSLIENARSGNDADNGQYRPSVIPAYRF